jgi:hypothetical protein
LHRYSSRPDQDLRTSDVGSYVAEGSHTYSRGG